MSHLAPTPAGDPQEGDGAEFPGLSHQNTARGCARHPERRGGGAGDGGALQQPAAHEEVHADLRTGTGGRCHGKTRDSMCVRSPAFTPSVLPQGTVPNKFYVHNDVFRYQDEVFADSDSEVPEGQTASLM